MKKIVCISGTLLLAASACVFVYANKQDKEVDLFNANVEVLVQNESGRPMENCWMWRSWFSSMGDILLP